MNALDFTSTLSLADFKKLKGINAINVVRNPNSGKRFFVDPDNKDMSGKVATAIDLQKPVFVSQCTTEDGEQFFMLHNSANVEATL